MKASKIDKNKPVEKLLKKHEELTQSDMLKVISHVQREKDDWFVNTLMIDGYTVPFRYMRKKLYKDLTGQRVNLTYYPITESVAGFDLELMKVVRVRVA